MNILSLQLLSLFTHPHVVALFYCLFHVKVDISEDLHAALHTFHSDPRALPWKLGVLRMLTAVSLHWNLRSHGLNFFLLRFYLYTFVHKMTLKIFLFLYVVEYGLRLETESFWPLDQSAVNHSMIHCLLWPLNLV